MKNIVVLLVLSVWAIILYAQPHVNWINYSFSQRVTDFSVDGDNLWISTQGGLVKYDKITTEKSFYNRANSNLPDNNLLGVFCTVNGDVWVSSKQYGIGKLQGSNCIIYNQSNSGLPFDQLNSKIKTDDKGNVWISSFRSMARFNGTEWKTWITGSDISAWPLVSDFDIANNGTIWLYSTDGIGKIENDKCTIISTIGSGLSAKFGNVKVDNVGSVWVAIEDEGIYKFDGNSFTNYNKSNSCLSTNLVYAIDFDMEGNMWLATAEGLILFDPKNCEIYQPTGSDKAILALRCDGNNLIWCGTISGKLLKFDGSEFSTIELSNSPLKTNYTIPLLKDAENNIWIGTKENIVKKTSSGLNTVFDRSGFAAIQNDIGEIWLGFNEGDTCLLKISGNENIVFDSLNSPFNANSKATARNFAFDHIGNLWISTRYYGLFKYNGTDFINFTTENSNIPSNEVKDLAFDKNNNLWGGSANGLFKFDGINWMNWNTGNSAIPTNLASVLTIDSDGNIWFACMDERRIVGNEFGGGLTKFDGQKMITYNIYNSGLLSNTIFGILDDGDKIWIATFAAGLMSFDKIDKWEVFDVTNSGIANNGVQGLVKDDNGNFWMGHLTAGISVFNPESAIQTVGKIDKGSIDVINSRIIIYPNPVHTDFYTKLNLLPNEKLIEASIYDLSGKLIQVLPLQTFQNDGYVFNFRIQSDLVNNQIFILRLKTNRHNSLSGKFLYAK